MATRSDGLTLSRYGSRPSSASVVLRTRYVERSRMVQLYGRGHAPTHLAVTRLTLGDVSFDIESCRVIRDGS